MSILELRTAKERTLFTVCLVVSLFFWAGLVLGTLGIGLVYIGAAAVFVLMTKALSLAAIKANGVRITREQLPELYARVEKAARKLDLPQVPEAYLLNDRGFFNALVTTFLGRSFVLLYAELLEACDEEDGSVDFIIGHELGHLALGHLKYAPLFLPSRLVPLLGAAYSRSCEYSCDRAGTVVAERPEGAIHGLAVLAAGGRYAKRLNVDAYLAQRMDARGFWASVVELQMSHPYLPKRMGAIIGDTRPEVVVPSVDRHPLAYLAAPFLGAGAGGGMLAAACAAGIMAAVAVPAFTGYQKRAEAAARAEEELLLPPGSGSGDPAPRSFDEALRSFGSDASALGLEPAEDGPGEAAATEARPADREERRTESKQVRRSATKKRRAQKRATYAY